MRARASIARPRRRSRSAAARPLADLHTGGGGGGGGKPSCDALSVCCAKLPDPAKGKCADLVACGDDLYCGNVKDNYCSRDPAACTKLQACCPTLSDEDKSLCEFHVSNFGTDVELCGIALKKYPSCAP